MLTVLATLRQQRRNGSTPSRASRTRSRPSSAGRAPPRSWSAAAYARAFAGHSLRCGFITTATRAGRTAVELAPHTGQSVVTIQRDYVEPHADWAAHPGRGLLDEVDAAP